MADLASDTVLEETPMRALKFLRGISRYPQIQTLLAESGYSDQEQLHGWDLALAAIGAPGAKGARAPVVTTAASQALMTIDAWDERGFARIEAALEGAFPEQHAFVFAGGLEASTGESAVVGVKTLLTRLDALETGKDRPAASQAQDQAAVARLAERGITKAERDRLAALVTQAMSLGPLAAPVDDSKHREALQALYLWYREWAKTARAVLTKRAYLISLGLAKRKSPKKPAPEGAPGGGTGKPAV